MAIVNSTKDISLILKIETVKRNQDFYRMRLVNDNIPLTKDKMFHVPFNLRGKVSTQRFGIPGFPSLYIGNTVYVCWEELGRPNLNNFQVVRLQTKKELKIIDLAPFNMDEYTSPQSIYRYFMTWPIIAACSVKVTNREDSFKPEYIIPQLLLQWVRNNQEVDGIKYQTTHINFKNSLTKGNLWNLVFPVKVNKQKGLCHKLKSKFYMTEPVSWQLEQVANGGESSYLYNSNEFNNTDNKIPQLEIIKGIAGPYSNSILGKLERSLDSIPASKI